MTVNNMTERCWLVLPGAGVGSRMQADRPKQYLTLNQRLLIDHTLERMLNYPHFAGIVLVLSVSDPYWPTSEFHQDSRIIVAEGGAERCYSVLNGLAALDNQAHSEDWVMVHDVARPCLHYSDIDKLLANNYEHGAILATPVRDTMKRGNFNNIIEHTVERQQLWHALTPQKFRYGALQAALTQCLQKNFEVTDEASAMEAVHQPPALVEGRGDNIKVTRPDDLVLAQFYLTQSRT